MAESIEDEAPIIPPPPEEPLTRIPAADVAIEGVPCRVCAHAVTGNACPVCGTQLHDT